MKLSLEPGQFGGVAPMRPDGAAPFGVACDALDVDTRAGTLKGFRTPLPVQAGDGDSLFVTDCCVMTGECTDWAMPEPGCGYVYRKEKRTGKLQRAVMVDGCPTDWCTVGFECAMPAPQIEALDIADDAKRSWTSALFTVRGPGWESGPSQVSESIAVTEGATVMVSGLPTDYPSEYCATEICIYLNRAGTINGQEDAGNVDYFRAGCFKIGTDTGTVKYGRPVDALGSKRDWEPPPPGLRDLQSWQDGQLAGLDGDELAFSERRFPHAWPAGYRMRFFYRPRRWLTAKRTGFVLTDGQPAVVDLTGNCDAPFCHDAEHVQEELPIIGMQSAAIVGESVVYASDVGLVRVNRDLSWEVLSEPWFDRRAWENINPMQLIGTMHQGAYIGRSGDFAFRLDIKSGVMMPLSIRPEAIVQGHNGGLFYIQDGQVYEWDAGDQYGQWRATYMMTLKQWHTFAYYYVGVAFPTVNAELRALADCADCNGGDVVATDQFECSDTLDLPLDCQAKGYAITLSGTGEAIEVCLFDELEEVA